MTKQTAIVTDILATLKAQANPERAQFVAGYFKTGPGQYGEGDVFWGLPVPQQRKVANTYWRGVTLEDVDQLLHHEVHEARLTALCMLVKLFQKAKDETVKQAIFDFYLDHTEFINNWDLVDTSAAEILGKFALGNTAARKKVIALGLSDNLWEKRMSLIAMFPFIRAHQYDVALQQVTVLLHDPHDLIHKATGWLLRDFGKQEPRLLHEFLNQHAPTMPRTTLRYAIEHFDQTTRKKYLTMKVTT